MSNKIRQTIKDNGADKVKRSFSGEWSTLSYNHHNIASRGVWLLFAQSDNEASKRCLDNDFTNVK